MAADKIVKDCLFHDGLWTSQNLMAHQNLMGDVVARAITLTAR